LLLQVQEDKMNDPKIEHIIKNHLEDLAYNRLAKVGKGIRNKFKRSTANI